MKLFYLFVAMLCLTATLPAQEPEQEELASPFENLTFQTGAINLNGDLATLNLDSSFKYLGPADANTFLESMGNPPGDYLGLLVPTGEEDSVSWFVVITYDEDGFVDDKDAAKIEYDDLLVDMKKGAEEANADRIAEGYSKIDIIGWAETPSYDNVNKKLYWAKELMFDDDPNHSLNYNVRVLGRKGVLVFNAVAGMDQLAQVKQPMENLLGMASFNDGNRYADFDPKLDKVAAYGIAGLIAGKLALKAGLFASLIKMLIVGKKLILVGFVGIAGLLKKIFGKKNEEVA